MLTLFVVQSRADKLDPGPAVKSFGDDLADEIHFVPNIRGINDKPKKNEWYAVIYDDEIIDEPLKEGLKVFIELCDVDMLILVKKSDSDKYFKCPRLFRRSVELKTDALLPVKEGLNLETVLNGFVHDNN